MKLKYIGTRPIVSVMMSGRINYAFEKCNDFTLEIKDERHAAQLLRSIQHRFTQVVDSIPVVEKTKNLDPFPDKKEKKGSKK